MQKSNKSGFNIYKFLRSSDIAEHCEKIGHVFSPLDMAIIIQLSNRTINEKHDAWKTIISDYPDMPIHKSINFKAKDSLHAFLKELIQYEEKNEECPDELDMIFFDLPVPFEKGAIVTMANGSPGVLDSISHWWAREKGYNYDYQDLVSGKQYDGSDMIAYLYFFECYKGNFILDHDDDTLDKLTYYRKELIGRERFLKYLSRSIKTGDYSIDWLINVFCKFQAEGINEDISRLFGSFYKKLDDEEFD